VFEQFEPPILFAAAGWLLAARIAGITLARQEIPFALP
jgi:hypothetical protein